MTFKLTGLIAFLLISININSQKNIDTIINYDDIITFKPSSENFISLLFQTHKNKIRLGQQNNYALKPDGTYISYHKQPALAKKIDKKTTKLQYSRQALYELLKLKFMTDVYADMDKEYLTKQSSSMYVKDKNSYHSQQHLLKLANAITSNKEMYRYFCNPKKEDCIFTADKNVYYYKNIINGKSWGGKEANEFQTLKSFTSYVQNNLETLQHWSAAIFPDNIIEGYFVVKTYLGEYDFKNQGYWINSNRLAQDGRFLLQYHDLEPANDNERKLVNPSGLDFLFKMTSTEAEKLVERTKNIYLVFNIKTRLKGFAYGYERIKASYTLESPIIEIYEDDDLTLKLAELSVDTMVTK
ncbi:hypothetical protein [Yeosuana marina]|uniref:hypothetical protein n=1 Tax=Yeosuana marina TaxID=1565536 RepID=UPI0030EE4E23|tara:strand:+ start:1090 stop:2154 length:1065 start_codon:yes stop_codon:yes gene_type:complete